MPITSESQRNRVALLVALNVLIVVAYAFYVLSAVATPDPLLIAALIAGLGYNIAELWFSTPYREESKPVSQSRTVRRTVARAERSASTPVLGRASVNPSRQPAIGDRSPLSERLGAMENERQRAGVDPSLRIDPSLDPVTPHKATTGAAVPAGIPVTAHEAALEPGIADEAFQGNERSADDSLETRIEEPDLLPGDAAAMDEVRHLPAGQEQAPLANQTMQGNDAGEQARDLVRVVKSLDDAPHSEHSALAVDFIEAEIETTEPVADVTGLERIIEAVEAQGEAAATMDALAELGTSILVESMPVSAPEAAETQSVAEVAAQASEARIVPATDIPAIDAGMQAVVPTSAHETPATSQPNNVIAALGADLIGDESAQAPMIPIAAAIPIRRAESQTEPAGTVPSTGVQTEGVAAKRMEEAAADGPATPAQTTSTLHLGGRVRDPVDIVIAQLQVNPIRPPQSAARQRTGTRLPAIPVPPRAATGLRASSETLAMLRDQLGVGKSPAPETRSGDQQGGPTGSVSVQSRIESARPAAAPHSQDQDGPDPDSAGISENAPRAPGRAPRRPSQVADSARDRVMFVWHGRHFLAPMEGRHPLRVAQSLYDFMVEEAMERG